MGVNIRQYRDGDEYAITDLFSISSPHARTAGFWRWANLNSPFGRSLSIVAEGADGRIIGHYAVAISGISYRGRLFKAGLGTQLVIHPGFRNFSVMWNLLEGVWGNARERGLSFIYAFPNNNIWAIKKGLMEWRAGGEIVPLELDMEKRGPSPGNQGAISLERVFEPHGYRESLDDIWASCAGTYNDTAHIDRNFDFIDWRFFRHPAVHYLFYLARDASGKAAGWLALKFHRRDGILYGHIVDLVAAEEGFKKEIISRAVDYFLSCKTHIVSAWGNGQLRRIYGEMGFSEKGSPTNFGVKTLAGASGEMDRIMDLANWDISMSYSDAF